MKPIVYIKMKPYLKEFILGLEGRDGKKLYGAEPVQFPKKDMLNLLVDRLRRKPGPGCKQAKPSSEKDRENYLKITFETDPMDRRDEIRIYLSPESQVRIAKYIYNMFCATAYEYVNEHLSYQNRCFPGETPRKNIAYREFCEEYGLTRADEDSIRKAFDRQARMFVVDGVKKKFEKKQNNRPFGANNRQFETSDCAVCD